MNKKNARLWIKDLRSGRYEQTRKELRHKDRIIKPTYSYCCLGVACNTYRKTTKKGKWNKLNEFIIGNSILLTYIANSLVSNWLGLSDYQESILINMNDSQNCSFNEIADQIELWIS